MPSVVVGIEHREPVEYPTPMEAIALLLTLVAVHDLNTLRLSGIHREQIRRLALKEAGPVGSNIVRQPPYVTELVG